MKRTLVIVLVLFLVIIVFFLFWLFFTYYIQKQITDYGEQLERQRERNRVVV